MMMMLKYTISFTLGLFIEQGVAFNTLGIFLLFKELLFWFIIFVMMPFDNKSISAFVSHEMKSWMNAVKYIRNIL